jgi:flagellar protein FliO/FliZ
MSATSPLAGADASAPAAPPALAPVLSSSAPAPPPAPPSSSSLSGIADGAAFSWGGYFEALAWLCFALALLCLILWLVKRRGGIHFPGASSSARIESRLALGPKKWLLSVHFQGRRLLLGVTDQHISLLCELPPEEDAPSRTNPSKTFARIMEKETGKPGGTAAT